MKWTRSIILLTTPLLASVSIAGVGELGWLAGCWAYDERPAGSGEYWTTPVAGSLLAVSRTVVDDNRVAFELLRIQDEAEGQSALYAQPFGKPATRFAQKSIGATSVAFENLEHDFPQRVIYRLQGAKKLLGRNEGLVEARKHAIDFPMTRIPCDNVSD